MAIDPKRGKDISLLVPFRDDNAIGRGANWRWLKRFWEAELPGAQITVGIDDGIPFSKSCAVNNAFQNSDPKNDIIVILDADCYIDPTVILTCADRIRESRDIWHNPLWFIPYRWLYRLTDVATARLIASDPAHPVTFPTPPIGTDVGSTLGAAIGHRYGALIQIMPREAFIETGGMDARHRGWGGEDVCSLRARDTLYCIHETTKNEVITLWHTAIGDVYLRKWAGQSNTGANNELSLRYLQTRRDPERMRNVVREWLDNTKEYGRHRITQLPPWYQEPKES